MKGNKKENLLGYEINIIPDRESGYFAVMFPDFSDYLCWYTPDINGNEPDFLL